MILTILSVLTALVISTILFALGLVVLAKLWYAFWYAVTFVLLFVQAKGNYSIKEHNNFANLEEVDS